MSHNGQILWSEVGRQNSLPVAFSELLVYKGLTEENKRSHV